MAIEVKARLVQVVQELAKVTPEVAKEKFDKEISLSGRFATDIFE